VAPLNRIAEILYTVPIQQRDNIVTNEEAKYTMSDPGNFLPPAVKKQIEARTSSGNPFTADEVSTLISSVLQERFQKDETKKVEKEEICKKRRKSLPPPGSASLSPLPPPPSPPSSSKEESKLLSDVEGVARLEAITKVEPQADSLDEATSKKKECEEGEPAIKKPRVESFVQRQSTQDKLQQQLDEEINNAKQKQSDNALQKQTDEAFQKELDEAKSTFLEQNELSSSDEAGLKPNSLEGNETYSSDESALKRRTKVVKNTKHGRKVVKKESPKSTSSPKKERGAKGKKHYEEDDHQHVMVTEI
jgi:hypothetical protein